MASFCNLVLSCDGDWTARNVYLTARPCLRRRSTMPSTDNQTKRMFCCYFAVRLRARTFNFRRIHLLDSVNIHIFALDTPPHDDPPQNSSDPSFARPLVCGMQASLLSYPTLCCIPQHPEMATQTILTRRML